MGGVQAPSELENEQRYPLTHSLTLALTQLDEERRNNTCNNTKKRNSQRYEHGSMCGLYAFVSKEKHDSPTSGSASSRAEASRSQPKPRQKRETRTWMDEVIDGAFLVVTSLAFLVFLVASLPHVAYFIVTFEPQNPDGTISDWWWAVAYLIAGAINITEFLLSIKFARDLRTATRGLPWYQKFLPTMTTVLKYWPFIILISGFSWAANLEHAEQFHSSMLATAESVKVIVPFFKDKAWGDINPYIVSAYPVLNIAYTLMFDSSRSSDFQGESESDITQELQPESESETAVQPVSTSDLAHLLQTMQAMQASQLQAMQEMQRESLKVTVETLHHLAGVKATPKPPRDARAAPMRNRLKRYG